MCAQADNLDCRWESVPVAVQEDLVVPGENLDSDWFPIQVKDQGVIS